MGKWVGFGVITVVIVFFSYFSLLLLIVSVELESLGPLLGQIVVALSPFVGVYHQQIASIFEFLIIKSRYVYNVQMYVWCNI